MGASRWLAGSLALLLAAGCSGLHGFRERMGNTLIAEGLVLSFERGADLLPPEGLRVTSTANRSIVLAWEPVLVGDVAGYAITRAAQPDAPFVLIGQTYSRFGTAYTDSGEGPQRLGDGQAFHYRVHPYDGEGRVSRSHAYVHASTDPRPATPSGLRAYSNLPRRVVLVWEPSGDPGVDGYVIQRSPTVAGPWEPIGASANRLYATYEDAVPGDLRVMYYRVLAKNGFGGESDLSEPVRAVTKAEPLPPIGLEVRERTLGRVEIGWEPNVELDVIGYEIWRSAISPDLKGPLERIGMVDGVVTEYGDSSIECGTRVRYRVRAVDRDGLVSAFSGPLEVESVGLDLAFEPPSSVVWNAERVPSGASMRMLRLRRWLPDQSLELDSVAGRASLPPGTQRLAALVEQPATATSDARAIRCDLSLAAPSGPS